ncbi:pyrokinin-1 receptor-like isoform X2 [Diabrotica virgifera virgifera]|uniref:G-protein coupled receptors family 1 profile domain-containing protein n=1 Tax=Diabrotica virgifera virgifera TaxID=50390 RepID=A0ABM5IAI5_DIAVI|nr:pyrokinin-1 receptor-like isoform X2 [Diabrotica virgifera virgifera]
MDEECSEEIFGPSRDSLYVVIPLTVLYIIIFLTGSTGNVSTCIVIAKNKSMHTATNYYLFSLAVSDQLLLLTGVPQEIYFFWSRYPYIFGSNFCFVRGLFNETSSNATVLIITAFTVERYLAICHPFLSHTMSNLSRAIKLIFIIWLVAISLAIPQVLPLKVVGKCPMCVMQDPIINYNFELSTLLFFVMPMTVITVLYILIGLKLKSSSTVERRISVNNRVIRKSSRKVIKMLVAVVVTFFICWAPFHIQRLYAIYNTTIPTKETRDMYMQIYGIITYISGTLFYTSATINPILYNIMSAKFRDAFKETFASCCFRSSHKLKLKRSMSVVSKSLTRCHDSSDSGSHDNSVQSVTLTILTVNKNYLDSSTCLGEKSRKANIYQDATTPMLGNSHR